MSTFSQYRLQYKYAVIDLETRQCYNVFTSTHPYIDEEHIEIEHLNFDYMDKYYIDGSWYEDAEGTIPWSPEE